MNATASNKKIFPSKQEVAEAFAAWLVQWLSDRSNTTIALSGGTTPKLLFQVLADTYRDQVHWSKVQLFWGDERCVPPAHEDSNYGMTKALLLDHVDIPATNVHRIKGEIDPEVEAQRYEQEIRQHVSAIDGTPAFDLIILGMGDDGHTASIFPHQMDLLQARNVCAVATHPKTGQQRISLTGPVLSNAYKVVFLVTGAAKAEKVGTILQKRDGFEAYPAAHIQVDGGAPTWFLDEAAAAGL